MTRGAVDSVKIPKIIHFVWVGLEPKPQIMLRCMESWNKYCPDYKFLEWGNAQLEEIDNSYVREAAAAGKWAFVSDYMRLYALLKYGGFYFDSDLEITGSIEKFRTYDFVTGFEKSIESKRVRPVTALMASSPGNKVIQGLLSEYEHLHFTRNGFEDLKTNTDRIKLHFRDNYGLKKSKYQGGEEVVFLCEGSAIFPYYFFCTPKEGFENYAVHHFNGSWVPPGKRKTLGVLRNYALLKFTLKDGEQVAEIFEESERPILKVAIPGKKKRVLALVRRLSDQGK